MCGLVPLSEDGDGSRSCFTGSRWEIMNYCGEVLSAPSLLAALCEWKEGFDKPVWVCGRKLSKDDLRSGY